MPSYIVRRLLLVVLTVFAALSFLFVLFFVLPGDPANLIAGGGDRVPNPIRLQQVTEKYGFDKPVYEQFIDYWDRTIHGDLGFSYKNDRSVNDILGERAKNSIRLAFWGFAIEIVVGIAVGLISAIRRYSLLDKTTTVVTSLMSAVPVFVLGFVLQYMFAVYPNKHGWPQWMRLRTSGMGPPGDADGTWFLFFIPTGEGWRYLVLPAVALASVSTALAARMTRGSMLEVLRADYMRTARSKGLSERDVVMKHGLRNAMLPVVTLLGLDFGAAIGSAVLTETVFNWPGLGSTIADAVIARDLPVMLGLTLVVVIVYSLINLIVDVSYAWFDPRVRLGGDKK